jgi:2-polyprenyl-3-methyl-5-hydroxy-6-metoxy-1,4-benzoquinol methylase
MKAGDNCSFMDAGSDWRSNKMTVQSDPEGNEIRALFDMADLTGKAVLEIGCGFGRLTWRYAEAAGHVTAIDPYEEWINQAKEDLPDTLQGRVDFRHITFDEFAAQSDPGVFDCVILSWVL